MAARAEEARSIVVVLRGVVGEVEEHYKAADHSERAADYGRMVVAHTEVGSFEERSWDGSLMQRVEWRVVGAEELVDCVALEAGHGADHSAIGVRTLREAALGEADVLEDLYMELDRVDCDEGH